MLRVVGAAGNRESHAMMYIIRGYQRPYGLSIKGDLIKTSRYTV